LTLLEKHFKGYLNKDIKIVVLADLDSDDCTELKSNMESAARNIGLVSRSQNEVKFQLINRIVIQELESWYLGDIDAIKIAYPKTKNYLSNALINRNPDYISNTWETLEKILKKAGYHRGGLKKEQAAIDITPYMIPSRNRSRSFQVFRDGLISLINQ